jgi:serine/threonine protein kinase
MSLAPGARLGPYEIVGAIGKGGMGEVYRAHDTRGQTFLVNTIVGNSDNAPPEVTVNWLKAVKK